MERKKRLSKAQKKAIGITPFISLFLFLAIGFIGDRYGQSCWGWCWTMFLLIPVMPYLVGAATIRISIPLIITIIYLVLGFTLKLWHPGWIIFILIPVFEILFDKKTITINKRDKDEEEPEIIDMKDK